MLVIRSGKNQIRIQNSAEKICSEMTRRFLLIQLRQWHIYRLITGPESNLNTYHGFPGPLTIHTPSPLLHLLFFFPSKLFSRGWVVNPDPCTLSGSGSGFSERFKFKPALVQTSLKSNFSLKFYLQNLFMNNILNILRVFNSFEN